MNDLTEFQRGKTVGTHLVGVLRSTFAKLWGYREVLGRKSRQHIISITKQGVHFWKNMELNKRGRNNLQIIVASKKTRCDKRDC